MQRAAPGIRSGGEAAKKKSLGCEFYTAKSPTVQAPEDHARHVADIGTQALARLGRRAGLYPRLVAAGRP